MLKLFVCLDQWSWVKSNMVSLTWEIHYLGSVSSVCMVAQLGLNVDSNFESPMCVCVGLLLKEQSDLAPHRLQIYANNVSRYMRQTYGQRSFPDVFFLTLWGLEMYAYKQVIKLHCNTFIK